VQSALLQDKPRPTVLGANDSESAGDAVVTEGEVCLALHTLPSHHAPGQDGPPLELWRLADGAWAPVLATLYSAMFKRQRTPFTMGRISTLHKGGPMSRPATRFSAATTRCQPVCLQSTLARLARSCLPALAWSKRPTYSAGKSETSFSTRS
jgi:hypothetical protein